jgi:hypothetical protein
MKKSIYSKKIVKCEKNTEITDFNKLDKIESDEKDII